METAQFDLNSIDFGDIENPYIHAALALREWSNRLYKNDPRS